MHLGTNDSAPPELGKDAFHSVRDFAGKEWDAVERVLTRFRGAKRAEPRRNSLPHPIQVLLLSLAAVALPIVLRAQQPPSAGTTQTNLAAALPTSWDTLSDTWVATDALGRSLP